MYSFPIENISCWYLRLDACTCCMFFPFSFDPFDYFYKYVPFKYVCVTFFCLGKKILKKKLSLTYNSSYNAQCPCKHYVFLCLFHPLSKIKCYESHVIFLMYIFSLRCFFFVVVHHLYLPFSKS